MQEKLMVHQDSTAGLGEDKNCKIYLSTSLIIIKADFKIGRVNESL
jgi:hypothetical protein